MKLTDQERATIQQAADAAHRVLCAGGDYGDELSDTGLRDALKASRDALRELLAAPVAADAVSLTDDARSCALQDMAFSHGLQSGWQFGVLDDRAGYEKCLASYAGYVKVLRETRPEEQPDERAATWQDAFNERHRFDVYPDDFMTGLRNEFCAGWQARATAPQAYTRGE